jgi:hypothetical protein
LVVWEAKDQVEAAEAVELAEVQRQLVELLLLEVAKVLYFSKTET